MTYIRQLLLTTLVLTFFLSACSDQVKKLKEERADITTALQDLKLVGFSAEKWPKTRKELVKDIQNITSNIDIDKDVETCKHFPEPLRLDCSIAQLNSLDFSSKSSEQLAVIQKGFRRLRTAIGEIVIKATLTDSLDIVYVQFPRIKDPILSEKYQGGFLVREHKSKETKEDHFLSNPIKLSGKLEIIYPTAHIGEQRIRIHARKVEAKMENGHLVLVVYHHPNILPTTVVLERKSPLMQGKIQHTYDTTSLVGTLHTDGQFLLTEDYLPLFKAELSTFHEMLTQNKLDDDYKHLIIEEEKLAYKEFKSRVKPGEDSSALFQAEEKITLQKLRGKSSTPKTTKDPAQGRTDNEIKQVFNQNKAQLFLLYQKEFRRDPTLMGDVEFKLSINPAGKVTNCIIVVDGIHNPVLGKKLINRIKKFHFKPNKDIESSTVNYSLEFLPD